MDKLQRFLVRRGTKEVFIWTQALVDNHRDLEEVMAKSAEEALGTKALPDPRYISVVEIESMSKRDLIVWAKVKLNIDLDASKKISELVLQAKQAIFDIPPANDANLPDEVNIDMRNAKAGEAVTQTLPIGTAKAARARKGA